MHPVLFKIPLFGGLTVYTYGVLVALGFVAGMWWVGREAKRVGVDPARATDLVFYVIVAALVGSRIAYVLISDRSQFFSDPMSFFRIWEGGLVFYGGLLGAVAVGVWYTRRHRLAFFTVADLFAPGIALGHAIGRLGCLMAGCCYGRVAPHVHWWTITFPAHERTFAPPGLPLYPTQPVEAVANLTIFLLLVLSRKRRQFEGQVFVWYLMAYAVVRSVIELYRGDQIRGFLIEGILSTSQAISLAMVGLAVVIWATQRRRQTHGT